MIYFLHEWGGDWDSLRWVGDRLKHGTVGLWGSRRLESGYAWTSWESDDPREVARARRRVESMIEPGEVLFGFSQGAMMALEVAFCGRVPLSAVIAVGSFLAPGGLARPNARVHSGPPTLLLHGKQDRSVPVSEAEKVLARISPLATTELHVVSGRHEVTPEMVSLARRFLRRR